MIPEFALRLIAGLSGLWLLLPQRQITSGFFRIQMLLTMALGVLAALMADHWDLPDSRPGPTAGLVILLLIGSALASFVGSVLWTLERRTAGTVAATLVRLLAVAAVLVVARSHGGDWTDLLRWTIDMLLSSAALGALTGAMLLGHWYLTATGMSLEPLQRATRLAQLALVTRLLFAIAMTATAPQEVRASLWSTHFIWTLLRWGAGLVGPLILAFLTPGTLKYRNTQSATGVLFAAVILIFIGEAAAMLLSRELEWPL